MTRTTSVVILGDTLLDRTVTGSIDRLTPEGCPVVEPGTDLERPGGAGLAAAAVAADGATAVLITAISDDEPGQRLRSLLWEAGVRDRPRPRRPHATKSASGPVIVRCCASTRAAIPSERSRRPAAAASRARARRGVGQRLRTWLAGTSNAASRSPGRARRSCGTLTLEATLPPPPSTC